MMVLMLNVLLLLLSAATAKDEPQCEEITIPMCRGIGYNYTSLPNQFNHDTQEEAGLEVHQFWPLVEIQCSPDLKFFLCSMYAPICMEDYKYPLPACRSVCERARSGCAPLMRQYGFAWPERMNCDKLPEYGDPQQLCMDSKNGSDVEKTTPYPYPKQTKNNVNSVSGSPGSSAGGKTGSRNRNNKQSQGNGVQTPSSPSGKDKSSLTPSNPVKTGVSKVAINSNDCDCECVSPLIKLTENSPLYNRVAFGGVSNCVVPCKGLFFSRNEKVFATFWIGLWSVLCFVCTLMTITTFLIDMQRFKYPERPIIFLSGCYMMVSVGYIVPLVLGPEQVACDGGIVRYNSTGPAACTAVFLLIYFFGMASSIWWVILAFTWFLAAGLKWGNEAIASYSQYFHLAAWLIPSIKSIAVLAMSSVDGDPISGICFVGNQNIDNLRGFVIAPLFVYLILGTTFLFAGFVSLFRIRNVIKQQGRNKTDKLEKLMIKIGIFSLLYTVPAVIVIGCYYYEQHYRQTWEKSHNCNCVDDSTPDYSIFMLRYFMCLGVGVTSGVWIWSSKTVDSWRRFYANLCGKSTYTQQNVRTYSKQSSLHSVNHPHLQKQIPLSHV
ncbi:frizzled receptor [Chamberlinius hualienensis]